MGFFISMVYKIDIDDFAQSIANKLLFLRRALTQSELFEHTTDYIVDKYPGILMGDLSNLRKDMLDQVEQHRQETKEEAERFKAHQEAREKHWQKEGFSRFTFKYKYAGTETNYANYESIPGLPGWSAPQGYDNYLTSGNFKGCYPIVNRDSKVNNHIFEVIPFTFIPAALVID